MRRAHTVEQVRAAEAELMARLPEGTLMQRAATGLAVAISNFLGRTYGARVVLLIGSGDNGGDALYAGARLARRGAQVTAVLLSSKAHAEGLAALLAAGGRVGSTDDIPTADVVVDGIVGIGGRPGLRPDALVAVELADQYDVPIVAVDTPSGVDVDTGETPEPHVRAALTVTFGTHKICHFIDPAAIACGPVHLVEIGLDVPPAAVESLQAADVRDFYPVPHGESDKYSRGVLGLMVGSRQYPGAAVIATSGALGGPVGMVRYVGPDAVAAEVRAAHPEIVAGEGRVQAWTIGSGLGDELDVDRIRELLDAEEPVVLDADGLKALDESGDHTAVLVTPHAGELSRMLGVDRSTVEAERLEACPARRRTLRRHRPPQGLHHRHRQPRRPRPRQHQRHPLAGHRRRRRRPGRPLRRPPRVRSHAARCGLPRRLPSRRRGEPGLEQRSRHGPLRRCLPSRSHAVSVASLTISG